MKNLDRSGVDNFEVSLLVANIDVFIWADLVLPYFVSLTIPVSIKFNKNT